MPSSTGAEGVTTSIGTIGRTGPGPAARQNRPPLPLLLATGRPPVLPFADGAAGRVDAAAAVFLPLPATAFALRDVGPARVAAVRVGAARAGR
jgi:hypothetical protein